MLTLLLSVYISILCFGALTAVFRFFIDVKRFADVKEKVIIERSKRIEEMIEEIEESEVTENV